MFLGEKIARGTALGDAMTADSETASDRPLHDYEDIAAELELIAEKVRNTPGLNHDSAERLLKLAQDIRSDLDRLSRALL
jgi:hypothetical protein